MRLPVSLGSGSDPRTNEKRVMPENLQPQPWWVAVLGGLLFTIRWLIGLGASGSRATIDAQKAALERLNARVDMLEKREDQNLALIGELRTQNALLRDALCRAGLDLPASSERTAHPENRNERLTENRHSTAEP